MLQNGKFDFSLDDLIFIFHISSEQVRGTADVFYLRPLNGQILESSLWFSNESLSPTIIDQILNRLKLLPDFYTQTKPVETGSTSTSTNSTTSPRTTNIN
jgi:hypothetical protein